MLEFDGDAARKIEAVYTTPDVVEQRRIVREALALQSGEHVLDIGCGPGFFAAEMAAEVGPEGRVVGIDGSESMLAIAGRRNRAAGAAPLELQTGDACSLPVADTSFDVVVSTQVYEYVADVPAALAEAGRALKEGGRLFVLDTDWDSIVWHSPDPVLTDRVLSAWDEHLADGRLPRRLPRLLRETGLELFDCRVVPILNTGYDPNTYSAGLLDIVASFVPGRGGIEEDEAQRWREGLIALGEDYFFSLNRYLFGARR